MYCEGLINNLKNNRYYKSNPYFYVIEVKSLLFSSFSHVFTTAKYTPSFNKTFKTFEGFYIRIML